MNASSDGPADSAAASRILVVDDESSQRLLMKRILEVAGHVVDGAEHGAGAIDAVNEVCPDLVVTDMVMPVMGGAELIQWLRANPTTADIPILVVSGDSHLAESADLVLAKPFGVEELKHAAEALLRKSGETAHPV